MALLLLRIEEVSRIGLWCTRTNHWCVAYTDITEAFEKSLLEQANGMNGMNGENRK